MINVLIVMPISTLDFGSKSSGGVDSVCQILLDSIVKSNQVRFNYTIIAFNPYNDLVVEGKCTSLSKNLTIYQYNCKSKFKKTNISTPGILYQNYIVWTFINKIKPQIFHTHLPSWQALPRNKAITISTLHAYKKNGRSSVSKLNDLLYEKIIPTISNKNTNYYTTVSHKLKKSASDIKKPIRIIYNPLPDKYADADIRQETHKTFNHTNIVTCSNITKNKGVHHAVTVLHELCQKNTNCHLHIIGELTNSEYQIKLIDQIQKLQLNNKVTFHGQLTTPEILNIYKKSDYGIFLSAEETFGLVPLEMIACGLDVITTRVGIMDDLYEEFSTFKIKIIENIDISEIANHIIERKKSMLNEARNYIVNKFTKDSITQQYESLYESVISAK
ncbi:VpsD family glycosyltransferase [Pseudomonas fragi]|uniref:VpsD family glycosyltransferase n=1 Tax=Pseudomonas fragi TaxID=296 RepID=UPI0030995CD9